MINALATGIFNKLKADGTLMTKLGGVVENGYKTYHIIAPQNAELPYIVFSVITDTPQGVFKDSAAIEDTTFLINCHSSVGAKDAGEIADLVIAVLDDAILTVAGFTNIDCRREMVMSPLFDIETRVYSIPIRYRAILDKT